jgi:hypothetical protein
LYILREGTMDVALLIGALILGFVMARLNVLPTTWSKGVRVIGLLSLLVLLFAMGLSLGTNSDLMTALPTLGFKALILSVGTVFGSVFLVWLVTLVRRPAK